MQSPSDLDAAQLIADLAAERLPDARGRYGPFGGRFVPETLVGAIERLEACAREALADEAFTAELDQGPRRCARRRA
jgi:tryptophan synthase beta chain